MKKGTLRKLFAASILACMASASQAAVDYWTYTVDMKWTDWDFSNEKDKNSKTTHTDTVLSWGYKGGLDGVVGTSGRANYNRSSLIITQPHTSGIIKSGYSVEQVNMFEHTNNEIAASYDDLISATMSVSVDLTPYGSTVSPESLTKNFNIFFYETPNVGGNCAWGTCSNDIFAFVVMPEIYDVFTYDGQTYAFNYFQTSGPNAITQLDASVCSAASRGALTTSCYGFTTKESAKTAIQFGFSITAVPEPETYAMLLAGLGMVGFVVRRRRNVLHD